MRIADDRELTRLLGEDIVRLARNLDHALEVLEAGCGRGWYLDLGDLKRRITGADIDRLALDHRVQVVQDLDVAILGDIRDPELLSAGQFDVVYSCYVLEHISGAEQAMKNFVKWLRPDGILILRIPDGSTVFGFLGKRLPHGFHVFYERRILGGREAGRPGHGPYRTVYDPIVSLSGVQRFCESNGLTIERVYKTNYPISTRPGAKWRLIRLAMSAGGLLSFGRLDSSYNNLHFVIRKEVRSAIPHMG